MNTGKRTAAKVLNTNKTVVQDRYLPVRFIPVRYVPERFFVPVLFIPEWVTTNRTPPTRVCIGWAFSLT